jgi:hypothetical protein
MIAYLCKRCSEKAGSRRRVKVWKRLLNATQCGQARALVTVRPYVLRIDLQEVGVGSCV